ncbi:uncharacterized protein LOC122672926 isoform X2 [Telopea speciosissima]|uniref:uncharacterized protein LOC122672926 isoform X2 n=1 Tax=Telopea speciosissima TaxID=54955 RepID=UPI001CC4B568|nr:uncharacterized protein LOC122672926 isoform X2 [Telopea speciosissima]
MECNKDEATRAREIAEKKFTAKDVAGAKKFALKAQNLYPGLEGLPQMLATFDVYISAENKISGEADWYGILGVSPSADDETVKKQYRKLALMLHPDKNKSVGADGAFKFILEAWSLLSDKTKRIAYDQKRNVKGSQQKVPPGSLQKVPPPSGGTSAPPGANGFYNSAHTTPSNSKTQKSSAQGRPPPAPPSSCPSKSNSFWTACNRCKMQYEYLRIYLNHNLLCPNCKEPFYAVETATPPSNGSNSPTPWTFSQQRQNSNHHTTNKNAYAPERNAAAPNMSATASGSAAGQATTPIQQAYEKARRERDEAQAAARREEALQRKNHVPKAGGLSTGFSNSGSSHVVKGERPVKKRRGMDGGGRNTYGNTETSQTSTGTRGAGIGSGVGVKQGSSETERVTGLSGIVKPNGSRELSQQEIRIMLMEKARGEIRKKLHEWSLDAVAKAADEAKEKEKDKVKATVKGRTCDQSEAGAVSVDTKKKIHSDKVLSGTSGADLDTDTVEPMSISVPDPDFHDFDKDRSERSFGDNQVWAAYDDDDGMPRYYAMIHKVISLNPFKMRISWLNSKSNSELGQLNWVGSGFAKTCGDFRIGKYEVNKSLNSFSHRVRWMKGTRGAIRIFPKKGDIWALYRNWSPDWDELTPDEVIHKYDMIEVLDDYDEEQGVTISPLVKVAGFKTVFHRHLDQRVVKRIPREEMFRFSHQVPSYMLTGQEGPNAPKGCRELDPAATPLELLQVIMDAKEEEIVENTEKAVEEEIVQIAEKANTENVVENPQKAEEEIVKNVKEADTEKMENITETIKERMVKAEKQPFY